jgi:glucose/arabinose dehydrogenase
MTVRSGSRGPDKNAARPRLNVANAAARSRHPWEYGGVLRRTPLGLCGALALSLAVAGSSAAAPAAKSITSRIAGSVLSRSPVRLSVPSANDHGVFTSARTLILPRGWKAEVWALVPDARLMAWTPQHALLVSEQYNGTVEELVPAANAAAPPTERVLLSGLTEPQGLAFDTLGGRTVLYVAESDQIDRYVWRGAAGVGARTVLVANLPDTDPRGDDVHRPKTLAIGADHRIYVSIGSAFNASTQDIAGNPPRASVVSYAPNGGDMRVLATGIRNGEGLAFAPDGVLWSAINERDEITYPFNRAYDGIADAYNKLIQAYVNNHPPDEVVALTPGRDVGWPYCDPDPSRGLIRPGWDDDAETNPGGTAFDCAKLAPINVGLPAHSAPLGFSFLEGSGLPDGLADGAVVAVHGSWDRQPPRPPAVLWMPWSSSAKTLGAAVTLISGFQYANGSRWGRPADAVAGPDGSLYVSDDSAGAIYRITP